MVQSLGRVKTVDSGPSTVLDQIPVVVAVICASRPVLVDEGNMVMAKRNERECLGF